MRITEAVPEDHQALTELTIESKSYWGYSESQIKEWGPDLRITREYIEQKKVFKLSVEDKIIAYYSYYSIKNKEILLDNMFVSPLFIRKGIGGVLMNHFLEQAVSEKKLSITTYSDPNSEAFYIHFGFEVIGREPTSIENRFLPILRKVL
jgi:GNAT superfamily N-acetyltransferase